jgi:hypothetical protein
MEHAGYTPSPIPKAKRIIMICSRLLIIPVTRVKTDQHNRGNVTALAGTKVITEHASRWTCNRSGRKNRVGKLAFPHLQERQ